jgi:putative nucleotidyltransferase with HDIG domain
MSTKRKLRRSEVRRQKSELQEPWLKRLRQEVGLATLGIWLGFTILAVTVALYGQEPFPYREGQEVRGPIYARVLVEDVDEGDTRRARERARKQVPSLFTLNTGLIERIEASLGNLYLQATTPDTFESYQAQFEDEDTAAAVILDQPTYGFLHNLAHQEGGESPYAEWVSKLSTNLRQERLVLSDADERPESPDVVLVDAVPARGEQVDEATDGLLIKKTTLDYFDPADMRRVEQVAHDLAHRRGAFPPSLSPYVKKILLEQLQTEPLFKYDNALTKARIDEEVSRIHEVKVEYPPDSALALAPLDEDGHRTNEIYYLTPQHVKLLHYQHEKIASMLTGELPEDADEQMLAIDIRQQHFFERTGLAALVVLMSIGMAAYCALFQARVVQNPVRAVSIGTLFLIMLIASRALHLTGLAVAHPTILVAPIIVTAAILTIVYNQRFAIGMTSLLAFLITVSTRGDLGTLLLLGTSMGVVIYQFREIRSRNELFSTGLLNGLAALIAAMTAGLVMGQTPNTAVTHGLFAAIAAVLSIAILFLFLSPIEWLFKVATNWTLLELLDTSKPLLTRLAQEAPGTYNHSLWLSAMAEDACETIGANGLLAKVGAMYHDVGKIQKPEYFAENQQSQINRHDKLAPTLSLLVIVGHVKDGVEMAREYGLPTAIIRFIEEHHGTTVVRYFHHAASEQQRASGDGREVPESEFRYPGPKPQSKETAVLMLCDGVEGAVRALAEPTAGRIENVVHNVFMDRLNDGQFDDCDITLRELHRVEQSLVKSLCRFYHGRVPYPKAEKKTGTDA